jgi:acetyltransferase-like isoleucine patch superfamily enzyme
MSRHTPATLLGEMIARVRGAGAIFWRLEARFKGVEFKGKCEFAGRPIISVAPGARMVVEDGVKIYSAARANPLGLSNPSVLRALAPGASVLLGRGVGISGAIICAGVSIEIGEGTIIGAGAMLMDNDFHRPSADWNWATDYAIDARPIKIGRGVFIGARAIILKGVTIGDRAVIGAGAVVAKDIPEQHVAVGNPARSFLSPDRSHAQGEAPA